MSDLDASPSRFWPHLVSRSAVLAVAAAAVTFVPDHSPGFGLIVLAVAGVGTGAVDVVSARVVAELPRAVLVVRGIAAVVLGLVGAALLTVSANLAVFVTIATALALVTVVAEALLSSTRREGMPTAVDRRVLAVVAALLGVGLLLSNGNSVVAVGLFGAWAAVTAVYSLITAFTLKGESPRGTEPVETP